MQCGRCLVLSLINNCDQSMQCGRRLVLSLINSCDQSMQCGRCLILSLINSCDQSMQCGRCLVLSLINSCDQSMQCGRCLVLSLINSWLDWQKLCGISFHLNQLQSPRFVINQLSFLYPMLYSSFKIRIASFVRCDAREQIAD